MKDIRAADGLQEKKAAVDRELERLLEGSPGSRLFEAMRYAVLPGGKRFRPLLLVASGEAFGGEAGTLLPYACAVELIHNYSLVHDDLPCMDDDDTRRGRPSCHKAFGEGQALLVGDGLLSLAFEVLAGAPAGVDAAGSGRKERAVLEIVRAAGVRGMIEGQWLDIGCAGGEATEASYEDIISKKTGALILAAVKAGAVLGGADASGLMAMEEFGRNVGLAFQLRDDVLDSGKEAERGDARTRPNSVALFGTAGAKERLARAVGRAVAALDGASIRSEELRHLAGGLLVLDEGGSHE